jgi:hypothetical protein
MPWPLQVVFWCQLAGLVVDLVQLLVASRGRPGLAAVAEYAVTAALVVFLMLKLRSGRRWVRSVIALVAAVALLFAVLRLLAGQVPPVALVVATAVTLVLLYWPSSTAFFRPRATP